MSITHETKVVTTCTRDCPSACGVIAAVADGQVVSLKGNPAHPVTRGQACGKLARYLDRVYSPDRILHPLRKDSSGEWQQISWDSALDEVAQKMRHLRDTAGPQSILYYQGFGTRTGLQLLNTRFFNRFGGVTTLRGTLCGGTGEAAQNLDFGMRISHDPTDHLNSKTIILWGRNPSATQQPLMPIVQKMRASGGLAVVVDPVYTATAKSVDRHIQPAPGKDLWLALAVAAHILKHGWQNDEFSSNYAEHYADFIALVEKWPMDVLVGASGVSADDVAFLAKRLCHDGPTAILLGWGLHRWVDAHESIRAIDALAAISGNIGIAGGGVSQGFDEWRPFDADVAGDNLVPNHRQLLMPKIGEEILSATAPPIEMIFVTAGNPVTMAPDSERVKAAFEKTSFVVYCGQFMDDTGAAANIFLPVTTWLEESDVVAGYGHDVVGPVNQVISPLGETRCHFDIFSGLASRLGIDDFERGKDAWLEDIIRPLKRPLKKTGVSLSQLREGPVRQGVPHVPYENKRFPTPSGRYQFLRKVDTTPDAPVDLRWPFALLTTSPRRDLCSEWLPGEQPPLPTLILSTAGARKSQVSDGDIVMVESKTGQMKARLNVDVQQRDDVAVIPRGGWARRGHGVNRLTESLVSKVGSGTAYYSTRVRVRPCE